MTSTELLKKDLFGEIRRQIIAGEEFIVRDTGSASPWIRCLSRLLLRREARILGLLAGVQGVPGVRSMGDGRLLRVYLAGLPMQRARPADPAYFRSAARLLRTLHRRGIAHNDLAKENNVLVLDSGDPAFVDFQLACHSERRGLLFRLAAYEDLRHLLKHKRTYCPQALTVRERKILDSPSVPSRVNRRMVKPLYLLLTRRILRWADREGAGNRGDPQG